MNLNQTLLQKKKENEVGGYQIMGPPAKPPPKVKQRSTSSNSSGVIWGKSCHSLANSSALRSGSTTISTENESRVIVALTEGRGEARCEVGLASIDISMPTLILCQISDSHTYLNTLTKINIFNPTDIIVPSTFLDSDNRLIKKLRQKFPNLKILGIPRKTFNKGNGMDRILQLCLPSINTIRIGLQHKYYALAAAAALLHYLQNNLNVYYAKESINVNYQESEGYAIIDVSTADRLELVSSTKPLQATKYSTLFGVLNYCVTRLGARLLRSTILQPPCAPSIIEKTSQCVTELIRQPEILTSIQAMLQKISNIDQLMTLTSMSIETTSGCSSRPLNYLLLLNSLIDVIEPLKDILQRCRQHFFRELKNTLESDNFVGITAKLRTMINPNTHIGKNEIGETQRCYAIKPGVNGLLDMARKAYTERLNDLNEYVKILANKYSLNLTLGNNNTKGFHIILKLNNAQKRTMKKSNLPTEFMEIYRLAGSFTMKTVELINFSTRLEDIMSNILKISNKMINDIIIDLKQYLSFFYKLCEDVSRLDMIQSLAEASRRGHYVKPKFGEFTELTNSKHPMLEILLGHQSVANLISICPDFNVQIITGPNGSGKSVYIRQIMLLQIMAQVGCYVPADSAIFKPMSRMFARIYFEDDLEYGASSFVLEMKEVKYLLSLLSDSSLFIIDELCRSTSPDEGSCLAMALCEKFCSSNAFIYVTTHYTSLANLTENFLNVKTWQMETVASGETPEELKLDFQYRLIPGTTYLKQYGVYIVKKIWPRDILEDVYKMLEKTQKTDVDPKVNNAISAVRLKYKLESELKKAKSLKKLTKAEINKMLNQYQNDLQKLEYIVELGQDGANVSLSSVSIESNQDLSNFLREDSANIDKLIPEISIHSSNRELFVNEDEEISGSIKLNSQNFSKSELEEIESCCQSLLADEDFDFDSSYKTSSSHLIEKENETHIFPKVQVIEGPQWSPESSPKMRKSMLPSIDQTNKTTSSSLHFVTRNSVINQNVSEYEMSITYSPPNFPENKTNSDLSHLRDIDNITLENIKSISEEKNLKSSSTSLKDSSGSNENVKRLIKRPGRFIPPKKLTAKEIQDDFDEQDRRLYDSEMTESEMSKLFAQTLNRPSVKQLRKSKHLAFVRKTENGVEVIPATPEPPKRRKLNFTRNFSTSSNIDLSIFSDKNEKCLNKFLNSEEKDLNSFKFNFQSKSKGCATGSSANFNFQPQSISEYTEKAGIFESAISETSQEFFSLNSFTPDGYYKENKKDVENIIGKYMPKRNSFNNLMFENYCVQENDFDL